MEDNIVQEWDADDASTSGALCYNDKTKIATSHLAALARHLDRSDKVTYCHMLHLRKSDTERLRLSAGARSRHVKTNPVNNTKNNPVNNPVNNPKNNPKNNTKSHDKVMTWNVKEALLDGHSPQTKAWHAGNVAATLSFPETQSVINTPGVVIHYFAFSHGGIVIENAGHYTTNHRFVVTATDKPIKLAHYNSYVLLTLPLGEWSDDVSWRRVERVVTDVFLNHPDCINTNRGGGSGSETTAGASIEFLLPKFRTNMRIN
jgi:hypothetical protein